VTYTFEEASQAGLLVECIALRLHITAVLNGAWLCFTRRYIYRLERVILPLATPSAHLLVRQH